MIIIEGPDSSGKSTLARRFASRYGYEIEKWGPDHIYSDVIEWLTNPHVLEPVVCDRFPLLSEEVYGPIMRGANKFSLKQQHNMHLLLQSLRPQIILATDVNEEEFNELDQLPSLEQNRLCAAKYKELQKIWGQFYPVTTYSYRMGQDYPLQSVVLQDGGPPVWWRRMFRDRYAGMGRLGAPTYFILAESIGPRNTHHIPFEAGPSGLFLSEVLKETNTPLNQVFITNYIKGRLEEAENQVALREELEQTKPGMVIVMGSIAKRGIPLIRHLGFPYTTIVHPAYWTRTNKPKEEYIRLFEQAKRDPIR